MNPVGNLAKAEAHWVNRDTIAWGGADPSAVYRLYHSSKGGIRVETESGVQGGTFIALTVVPGGLLQSVLERFPHLMGFSFVDNLLEIKRALHQIDPTIYLYGEGWDFGEVKGNSLGINATQANMAGTGIGTFSDLWSCILF